MKISFNLSHFNQIVSYFSYDFGQRRLFGYILYLTPMHWHVPPGKCALKWYWHRQCHVRASPERSAYLHNYTVSTISLNWKFNFLILMNQ